MHMNTNALEPSPNSPSQHDAATKRNSHNLQVHRKLIRLLGRGLVGFPPVVRSTKYPLRCISRQADQRKDPDRSAATEVLRPILRPLPRAALRPEASSRFGGRSTLLRESRGTCGGGACSGARVWSVWDQLTGREWMPIVTLAGCFPAGVR